MKITLSQLRGIIRETIEDESRAWDPTKPEIVNHPLIAAVIDAADPKELAAAKRAYTKADDRGEQVPSAGAFFHWYDKRKEELKNIQSDEKRLAAGGGALQRAARSDAILRTRDSTGRAKARKF